ncbi:DUF3560 domain-containing protein [Microbulbifer discodermiae]|uniref:DUF3560 domain-containing protein n=1 Tax=Microbulbifer sp. 2201CG32-9 TaxID=3232309 RepID=UPI00345B9DBF
MTMTATYSAEDNKLRLYPARRLDDELYARVKEAGFKWAPKQELFVAPKWSPAREDLCVELAGEIEPEELTLAERAQMKAERLEGLAVRRTADARGFAAAAASISERFAMGQPILIGHHSEKKARKDKEKLERNRQRAVKAQETAHYWNYRAQGVERFANMKSDPFVIARRIDTLLKELRTHQRTLNDAFTCLGLWQRIEAKREELEPANWRETVQHYVGMSFKSGYCCAAPFKTEKNWSMCGALLDEELSHDEALQLCLTYHARILNSQTTSRYIQHTLNRLAFERSRLGEVARFDGDLKATTLQAFARTHGADTPKATRTVDGFTLKCASPLPVHLGEGLEITLSDDGWCDLMQAVGYTVPEKKRSAKPPLLNLDVKSIEAAMYGRVIEYEVRPMAKSEHAKIAHGYKGVRLSTCGQFRFRTAMVMSERGSTTLVAILLTDSKKHAIPESDAVKHKAGAVA